MRLLVAYDVSTDANRRRVYETLQRYGAWKQFSVFEVEVTNSQRVELTDQLESHIEPSDGDRIRIYRLCDSCLDDVTELGVSETDDASNVV